MKVVSRNLQSPFLSIVSENQRSHADRRRNQVHETCLRFVLFPKGEISSDVGQWPLWLTPYSCYRLDLVHSYIYSHCLSNTPNAGALRNTTQKGCSPGFEVDILKIRATKTSSLPSRVWPPRISGPGTVSMSYGLLDTVNLLLACSRHVATYWPAD